jgi:hypothetical protein
MATTVHFLSMIILKHIKQENGQSFIEIVLDPELSSLRSLPLTDKFLSSFRAINGQKNAFRYETNHGDLAILDIMKLLRGKSWALMTSHSFTHFAVQKVVESHFYFERIQGEPSPSLASSVNSSLPVPYPSNNAGQIPSSEEKTNKPSTSRPVDSRAFPQAYQHATTTVQQQQAPVPPPQVQQPTIQPEHSQLSKEKHDKVGTAPKLSVNEPTDKQQSSPTTSTPSTTTPRPHANPEVLAFVLDKTSTHTKTAGPYGFATRTVPLRESEDPAFKTTNSLSPPSAHSLSKSTSNQEKENLKHSIPVEADEHQSHHHHHDHHQQEQQHQPEQEHQQQTSSSALQEKRRPSSEVSEVKNQRTSFTEHREEKADIFPYPEEEKSNHSSNPKELVRKGSRLELVVTETSKLTPADAASKRDKALASLAAHMNPTTSTSGNNTNSNKNDHVEEKRLKSESASATAALFNSSNNNHIAEVKKAPEPPVAPVPAPVPTQPIATANTTKNLPSTGSNNNSNNNISYGSSPTTGEPTTTKPLVSRKPSLLKSAYTEMLAKKGNCWPDLCSLFSFKSVPSSFFFLFVEETSFKKPLEVKQLTKPPSSGEMTTPPPAAAGTAHKPEEIKKPVESMAAVSPPPPTTVVAAAAPAPAPAATQPHAPVVHSSRPVSMSVAVTSSKPLQPLATGKSDETSPHTAPKRTLSFKLFGSASEPKIISPATTSPVPTESANHQAGKPAEETAEKSPSGGVPVFKKATNAMNKLFNKYQPTSSSSSTAVGKNKTEETKESAVSPVISKVDAEKEKEAERLKREQQEKDREREREEEKEKERQKALELEKLEKQIQKQLEEQREHEEKERERHKRLEKEKEIEQEKALQREKLRREELEREKGKEHEMEVHAEKPQKTRNPSVNFQSVDEIHYFNAYTTPSPSVAASSPSPSSQILQQQGNHPKTFSPATSNQELTGKHSSDNKAHAPTSPATHQSSPDSDQESLSRATKFEPSPISRGPEPAVSRGESPANKSFIDNLKKISQTGPSSSPSSSQASTTPSYTPNTSLAKKQVRMNSVLFISINSNCFFSSCSLRLHRLKVEMKTDLNSEVP